MSGRLAVGGGGDEEVTKKRTYDGRENCEVDVDDGE